MHWLNRRPQIKRLYLLLLPAGTRNRQNSGAKSGGFRVFLVDTWKNPDHMSRRDIRIEHSNQRTDGLFFAIWAAQWRVLALCWSFSNLHISTFLWQWVHVIQRHYCSPFSDLFLTSYWLSLYHVTMNPVALQLARCSSHLEHNPARVLTMERKFVGWVGSNQEEFWAEHWSKSQLPCPVDSGWSTDYWQTYSERPLRKTWTPIFHWFITFMQTEYQSWPFPLTASSESCTTTFTTGVV